MKIIDVPQSGKCGLTVSYGGRNGLIRRAWTVPSNPRTAAQMNVRTKLAAQAEAFKELTTEQQDAWNAAAASYQTKSRLGQSGPLTGLQFFVKMNATLTLHGQAAIDTPTARPTLPPCPNTALVITYSGGTVAIKLTTPTDPGET
ncbi:MAG: hypothetical protein NT154_12010, partial [Verrucomicrobia bacterium]|nr:hypothetical protein [Verrucomicrobiota bacterium]